MSKTRPRRISKVNDLSVLRLLPLLNGLPASFFANGFLVPSPTRILGDRVSLSASVSALETVQGPLTPSLLASSWGESPMLIQNAFDVNQESSFWPTWEDIVTFACLDDADARLLQHVPGDLTSFTLDIGPFDPSELNSLMKESQEESDRTWTLVVNDVDRFHPPLSDWMDDVFGFVPRWRRDDGQVSLAPSGGGIGPHVDNYDVFVIQTSGKRSWQVGTTPLTVEEEQSLLIEDLAVRILSTWEPSQFEQVVLKPGDVLYLPPRVAHCGTSLSDDCMTLSVGCRAPSASDLVSGLAQHMQQSVRSSAVRRYQDADLLKDVMQGASKSFASCGELTVAVKQQMKDLVLDAVNNAMQDESVWDRLVGELVTEPNRPRDNYPVPLDEMEQESDEVWGDAQATVKSVLSGRGALFRAEGVSFTYSTFPISEGVTYRVFANGDTFEVTSEQDDELRSLVQSIVEEPCLTKELFSTLTPDAVAVAVTLFEQLVNAGMIYGAEEA